MIVEILREMYMMCPFSKTKLILVSTGTDFLGVDFGPLVLRLA
jgi:hypothetical protein